MKLRLVYFILVVITTGGYGATVTLRDTTLNKCVQGYSVSLECTIEEYQPTSPVFFRRPGDAVVSANCDAFNTSMHKIACYNGSDPAIYILTIMESVPHDTGKWECEHYGAYDDVNLNTDFPSDILMDVINEDCSFMLKVDACGASNTHIDWYEGDLLIGNETDYLENYTITRNVSIECSDSYLTQVSYLERHSETCITDYTVKVYPVGFDHDKCIEPSARRSFDCDVVNENSGGLSGGAIAGICICMAVACGGVAGGFIYYTKTREKKSKSNDMNMKSGECAP